MYAIRSLNVKANKYFMVICCFLAAFVHLQCEVASVLERAGSLANKKFSAARWPPLFAGLLHIHTLVLRSSSCHAGAAQSRSLRNADSHTYYPFPPSGLLFSIIAILLLLLIIIFQHKQHHYQHQHQYRD